MMSLTTQLDLEKFFVDFGPQNGEEIFYGNGLFRYIGNGEKLSRFVDSVELMNKVFGYNFENGSRARYPATRIRKGKFKASEIKQMCINFKIDPKKLFSEYEPKISMINRRVDMEKLDDEIEIAIFNAICDGL
jgi:hypothetical protein